MDYQESSPVPALAPIVDRIWTLTGHVADLRAALQPVLPDGRPELVMHFGEPFERVYSNGRVERQAAVIFAGQLVGQLELRPIGRISVLGVRFHPHGAASVLKIPQQDLVGLTLGVDMLSGPLSRALAEVQDSAADLTEAASLVQHTLVRWVNPSHVDARVQFAVEAIRRCRGRVSIDALARRSGLTRRHLERRFLRTVGVSPKRLARVARFQHALRLLEHFDASRRCSETAVACGYADQSHFIRDFRDLAGCAPTQHLLRQGELTGFFTQRG